MPALALSKIRRNFAKTRLITRLQRNGERSLGIIDFARRCINQRDVKERGHQVGVMRDIYSNAVRTLIWLGEESTATDNETNLPISGMTLEFFDRVAADVKELVDTKKDSTFPVYISRLFLKSTIEISQKVHFSKDFTIFHTADGGSVCGLSKRW